MEEKRLKDYIAEMEPEDYEKQFANIEAEEKVLRIFLSKIDEIDENILPQVTMMLDDVWQLPYEHKSVVDFIVDLYKCELTNFHDGGVEEYIDTIKNIIQYELAFDEYFEELEEIFDNTDFNSFEMLDETDEFEDEPLEEKTDDSKRTSGMPAGLLSAITLSEFAENNGYKKKKNSMLIVDNGMISFVQKLANDGNKKAEELLKKYFETNE